MRVDIARGVGEARDIEALIVKLLLVGELAGTEHILQTPDLSDGGKI
jgi:hypothetical protein